MKVVFHERYKEVYTSDPAAAFGRLESIVQELQDQYVFTEPAPAGEDDVKLVHQAEHIQRMKQKTLIYELAMLAAGGAILASELAMQGESAFGLIRPPGHHASPGSCWGFCWFNNVAIAVEKLRAAGRIKKALIVDFDLHYGDGTANIFARIPEVVYYHGEGSHRQAFLDDLKRFLEFQKNCDLVAVSAGFDRHEKDWGGLLKTEDYQTIGTLLRDYARQTCQGKVFAVLEGGYNHDVLGKNVKSFLEGLRES